MKRFLAALSVAMVATSLALPSFDADAARRLGGGKSFGMQRDSTTLKRDSTLAAPANSAAPVQSPAAQGTPGMATAQPQPKRSWLGPLAGLAAGLGLGALLAGGGFGGMLGTLMTGLLIAMAVFVVLRLLRGKASPTRDAAPLQYAGSGTPRVEPGVSNPVPGLQPAQDLAAVSARSASGVRGGGSIPADFDIEGFVRNAKLNFVRLQSAFDAGNAEDLREFTAPEVFAELKLQIDERGRAAQQTDILQLDAEVLDVTTEATRHVVSVHYYGQVREGKDATAERFDEVWHLTKPIIGGSGWVVAGIQQTAAA